MSLLPDIETEAELSYAYLHAVAAQAKMSCEVTGRHTDKMGIDATIRASEKFSEQAFLTDLVLDIQLKATIENHNKSNGKIAYFIKGADRYEKLRKITVAIPRILVVLFLPSENIEWLKWSPEELSIRKCAWWVSLRYSPESNNKSGQTVYFPEDQFFNSNELRKIMTRLSQGEELIYAG